ncbi:Cyp-29A4 [Aphelenchoides fujianensis]|nr:Cyp-29A4 [Aphelenchoides fujianensis]
MIPGDFLLKAVFSLFVLFFARWLIGVIKWANKLAYHRRMTRDIPGPETRPLIGSLHLIRGGLNEYPFFLLREAKKVAERGGGVFKLWVGPIVRLYVFEAEAARVITSSTTELKKAFDYDRLHAWLGGGLVTSEGEKWRRSRRLLTPAFHFGKLEEYSAVMDEHARELVGVLETKADGHTHDIFQTIKLATLDTIAETAMGIRLDALKNPDQPYIRAVAEFLHLTFLQGTNPLYLIPLYWKYLGYEKKKADALKVLRSMSSEVIRKRLEAREAEAGGEQKSRPDFLDILLEANRAGEMTFEECREQVDTFLFAGYDTTSHALSWILWCLATHPAVQKRVHEEIEREFGGRDEEFASNRMKELPYCEAVIKEALRMFPPIAGIGRELREELEVGGHRLPAGSTVNINMLLLHHNEKVFPNSWTFDPERFAEGRELPPTAYLPFSAGVRNCIGQRFANREIRVFLAHLLHNFRVSTDHNFLDNRPRIEIVLVPTLGVPVRIERRR